MNLSRKTVLVIVSTFIALVFIVAATSDIILLRSFADLEKKVLRDDISKVVNEIEESFSELDATVKVFTEQLRSKASSSMIATFDLDRFVSHRIDLIACYDLSGNLLAARGADFHGKRFAELSPDQLRDLSQAVGTVVGQSGSRQWHGFLPMSDGIVQFALRPFANGTVLLVGRYLDKQEIARVSSLTKFSIDIHPFNQDELPSDFSRARDKFLAGAEFHSEAIDANRIAGYVPLHDIYEKPALLLKLTELRLVFKQGKASIMYILLALILSGAVLCGVMLLFIRGTVLKRLASLSATVGVIRHNRDITARIEVRAGDQHDELDELAASINSMLGALESAETSLKESEERYRALFERAPDSIVVIGTEGDEAGRIVAANRAAALQHGYSLEELCTMKIHDLNTPESNRISEDFMIKVINGEWVTFETWHTRKDGSQFPLEVHGGPFKIQGRTYVLGFDRDITSRKLAEESAKMYLEQIHHLNNELERKATDLALANKELETFNYSVSHDMRGPLTRISGYCQLMLDDTAELPPQIRTYLNRIYVSSCWLDEMIDAMLNLSRLIRVEFSQEPVNLTTLCEEQLNSLRQAEPGRVVDTQVAPDVMTFGDVSLLRILMANLVNNAWKYSAQSARARIEFGVIRDSPVPVYFIRDNGTGFDMKDADKLFRAFTRLHDPTQFNGSGIGLATVQRIITRHGGKVWAEGEAGKGATFYFSLAAEVKNVL
jgi:PAS domain S-box-containing protein